jgi:hypothetical protein
VSALVETTDLVGVWGSPGVEPVPQSDGSSHYTSRTFTLTPDSWEVYATAWADAAGERPLFALRAGGVYVLGGAWEPVPGARTLDLGVRFREITLMHPPLLDRVRAAGHPRAALGRPESLARWGALRVPSVREAPAEYELLLLDDDGRLHMGQRGPGTYRREGRPRQAHPYGLERVGHDS